MDLENFSAGRYIKAGICCRGREQEEYAEMAEMTF